MYIFIDTLHDDDITRGYFQQVETPSHSAQAMMDCLNEFYDDSLVAKNRWPANSPDLIPSDFFLFGNL